MRTTILLFIAACFVFSGSVSAQTPHDEARKKVSEHVHDARSKARKEGKDFSEKELRQAQKEKATEVLRFVNRDKLGAEAALGWARIYYMAEQYQDAIYLCEKVRATSPTDERNEQAIKLQADCYRELGDGKRLAEILIGQPWKNSLAANKCATETVRTYADAIRRSEGLDSALKTLDSLIAKLPEADHKAVAQQALQRFRESEKRRASTRKPRTDEELLATFEQTSRFQETHAKNLLTDKKARFLLDAGRRVEAVQIYKGMSNNSSLGSLQRATLIGETAPSLPTQTLIGEFKGLESLKGKVVVLDFCGVPQRGFWGGEYKDLRKLYADLHSKGVEVVSVAEQFQMDIYYGPGRSAEMMPAMLKEMGVSWPVIKASTSDFKAYSTPVRQGLVLLDRSGMVRGFHSTTDIDTFDTFRARVEELARG